jgi:hypothetical protein
VKHPSLLADTFGDLAEHAQRQGEVAHFDNSTAARQVLAPFIAHERCADFS